MDPIYLFIVTILLGLVVLDLSVGVANDAVNFLNSSIGSKAAHLHLSTTYVTFMVRWGLTQAPRKAKVDREGKCNSD